MSTFTKLDSFRLDSTCSLTKWVATSGLTLLHLDRVTAKLSAQIIMDTRAGGSYETAGLLDQDFRRIIEPLNESNTYSRFDSEVELESTTYTLDSYGWPSFKRSFKFYMDHILCRDVEENYPGELARKYAADSRKYSRSEPASRIRQSCVRSAIFGEHELDLPCNSCASITLNDIKDFLVNTHRAENMCIIIEGRICEKDLHSLLSDLHDPNSKEYLRNKVEKQAKKSPSERVAHIPTASYTLFAIFWHLSVKDPVHYMSLWILRTYFVENVINAKAYGDVMVSNLFDFLGSTFAFDHHTLEKVEELADHIRLWPQTNEIDLKSIHRIVHTSILFRFATLKSLSGYFQSSFLYERGDISSLKLWANGRSNIKTLLSWDSIQWSRMVSLYLVENEPYRINLYPSKSCSELVNSIDKMQLSGIENTYANLPDNPVNDLIQFEDFTDCNTIEYPASKSYTSGYGLTPKNIEFSKDSLSKKIELDSVEMPLSIHFEDFDFDYTTVLLVFDTSRISPELRTYTTLLADAIEHRYNCGDHNFDGFNFSVEDGFVPGKFWDYSEEKLEIVTMKFSIFPEDYYKDVVWVSNFLNSILEKDFTASEGSLISLRGTGDKRALKKNLMGKDGWALHMRNLARQLFKLENLKVFILGNVEELDLPVSAWTEFVARLKAKEEEHFEKFSFDPIPFESMRMSNHLFENAIPECGQVKLVDNDDYVEWTNSFTSLNCDESEHLKILTCLLFLVHDTYSLYSFQIHNSYLICKIESSEEYYSLQGQYVDGDEFFECLNEHDHDCCCPIGFFDNKWSTLEYIPFVCNNSFDSALNKVRCLLRNESTQKEKKFADLLTSLTDADVKKTLLEHIIRLFDPKSSSMVTALTDDMYSLAYGYKLCPDSEKLANSLGATIHEGTLG